MFVPVVQRKKDTAQKWRHLVSRQHLSRECKARWVFEIMRFEIWEIYLLSLKLLFCTSNRAVLRAVTRFDTLINLLIDTITFNTRNVTNELEILLVFASNRRIFRAQTLLDTPTNLLDSINKSNLLNELEILLLFTSKRQVFRADCRHSKNFLFNSLVIGLKCQSNESIVHKK